MKLTALAACCISAAVVMGKPYAIVDTGQIRCYDDRTEISFPKSGKPYYGQDAQYAGNQPSYKANGDGTVSDLVTGLVWTQDPGEKMTYDEAVKNASKCRIGGYSDWRLPTIKELYSLISFNGIDPDPRSRDAGSLTPFINTNFFKFQYGKEEGGDRIIDSQFATCTIYKSTTMGGNKTMFGVNFADGRIKGYPAGPIGPRGEKTYYVLYVRGNPAYGKNDFADNGDGTVTDRATGLTWMQADSGKGMDWPAALEYAENMKFAGHDDWRLPNAKELQSIVDYTRCPDTTGSAAIDPIFQCSEIVNEAGQKDCGHYWSGTTHIGRDGSRAVYIAFGRALGNMHSQWMDVHGAGAQRSDQKTGDESQLPVGHGPQGDVQRINNYVRLVRGGTAEPVAEGNFNHESHESTRKDRDGSPSRPQGSGFMAREDRNGDGKVTRDEFRGPSEHFDRLDKNGDGIITEDEAPSGPPPGGLGERR
jgi:hypothetical protein